MKHLKLKATAKKISIAAVLLSVIALATACEQEGPAERAGKKIDEAVEKGQDQIEQGVESAGEKLEEAGDTIREKTQ